MKKMRMTLNVLAVLTLTLVCASLANAQATRTWVSGVGDDVNPCSRTAPCKTFAGAISKTAASGEIDALDPGGFGAVTITKSITIRGAGQMAGISAALTNGIIVNAGVNDVIHLDNIYIDGMGNGLNGIRYLAGKAVFVENCSIEKFTQNGIDMSLNNTSGTLNVSNSNFFSIGTTELDHAGVRVQTAVAGNARVTVNNCIFVKNKVAVHGLERTNITVRNSTVTGDLTVGTPVGFQIVAATTSNLAVESCNISFCQSGIRLTENAGGVVEAFVSNTHFHANTFAYNIGPGAEAFTYTNNRMSKNGTDFSGTVTGKLQQ